MEINLEPLLKLEQAMKKWKIMHIEGLKHLRLIPDLFDAATGRKTRTRASTRTASSAA